MQSVLRDSDIPGRLGGNEFVVIVPDVLDQAGVEDIIARIKEAVSRPVEVNGQAILLDCAIGFAVFPDQGQEFDTLIREADMAMYHAKRMQQK